MSMTGKLKASTNRVRTRCETPLFCIVALTLRALVDRVNETQVDFSRQFLCLSRPNVR